MRWRDFGAPLYQALALLFGCKICFKTGPKWLVSIAKQRAFAKTDTLKALEDSIQHFFDAMATLRLQVGGRCSEEEVEILLRDGILKLGAAEVKLSELLMASVALKKGQLELVLVSHTVDFMELKLGLTPKAAELVQAIREHVELSEIPRGLLRWPLRTLHPHIGFQEVYWGYQVLSNTLEIMFAFTFFLTLKRRLSSSAEGVVSSLDKLQQDISSIISGDFLEEWPIVAILHSALRQQLFGSWLLPLSVPFQILVVLLDFHADLLILTMLLPHAFLLWHSITSLIYAAQKACSIVMRVGRMGQQISTKPTAKKVS